jgi:hypothetical protein
VSPWLITPFAVPASRHLLLTLFALRSYRIDAFVVAAVVATATIGYRAVTQALHRSGSRKGSSS